MAGGGDCAQRVAWGFGVGSTLGASIGEDGPLCLCVSLARRALLSSQSPASHIQLHQHPPDRRAVRHVRGLQEQGETPDRRAAPSDADADADADADTLLS